MYKTKYNATLFNNNNTVNIHNNIEHAILAKNKIIINDIVDLLNLYFYFNPKMKYIIYYIKQVVISIMHIYM